MDVNNAPIDEAKLLLGLRAGDATSFELVVRTYGGYLMAVTRRYLNSDADVQDSVQDTFIQVWHGVKKFEGRSSLKSWLHRIAVNTALMKIRASGRRYEDLIDDSDTLFDSRGKRLETESEVAVSVEAEAINDEERNSVRAHIASLPDLPRHLLMLRDIEGFSTEETAK